MGVFVFEVCVKGNQKGKQLLRRNQRGSRRPTRLETSQDSCGALAVRSAPARLQAELEDIRVALEQGIHPGERKGCMTQTPLVPFLSTLWWGFPLKSTNGRRVLFLFTPRESQNAGRESLRKLIAEVTKESPAAKDPRKPACCVTLRRESVAKAIRKKPKPAKAKHGVAKASRKGPPKQKFIGPLFTQEYLAPLKWIPARNCLAKGGPQI